MILLILPTDVARLVLLLILICIHVILFSHAVFRFLNDDELNVITELLFSLVDFHLDVLSVEVLGHRLV